MSNQEKLKNLIRGIPGKEHVTITDIARHLDENGVIALPCKIGSRVWIVNRTQGVVFEGKFRLDDLDQIGKRVFFTKFEAERMLRGKRR